jgi:hypothetical protein
MSTFGKQTLNEEPLTIKRKGMSSSTSAVAINNVSEREEGAGVGDLGETRWAGLEAGCWWKSEEDRRAEVGSRTGAGSAWRPPGASSGVRGSLEGRRRRQVAEGVPGPPRASEGRSRTGCGRGPGGLRLERPPEVAEV